MSASYVNQQLFANMLAIPTLPYSSLACFGVVPSDGPKRWPESHYGTAASGTLTGKDQQGWQNQKGLALFSVELAHWYSHFLVSAHTSFSSNLWAELSQTEAGLRGEATTQCPRHAPASLSFATLLLFLTPSTHNPPLPRCGCILIYARHRKHSIQPSVCSAVDSC